MADMNHIRSLLEEKRQELADQLDAIDRAIAALGSAAAPVADTGPEELDVPAVPPANAVIPRAVKSRRVLSDAHKKAISAGKRKARAAKDAAKGLAREMPDDSFVPAIKTRGKSQAPRLVKRPIQK